MPTLVDAYNVLHVVGVLPPELAGIDLEELAALLAGSRFDRDEVLLICDGIPKPHRVEGDGRIHVRFAGAGTTADELIIHLVRTSSAPRRLTVVSSDREITEHARRRRAAVLSSESFLALLAKDHAGKPRSNPGAGKRTAGTHRPDRRQVEDWLKLFNVEDDLLDLDAHAPRPPRSSEDPPQADGDSETPPVVSTNDPSNSALEAGHLDEIRLEDIERIDMSELLDETGRLRKSEPDEPPLDDDPDSADRR
ncbi:MAG: NYN domain-containing protein [Phycisphaerales bacterium]|jgi:hypothetical protein|nr:NYN domain-containing protein [Phycisphaerales bacterium]